MDSLKFKLQEAIREALLKAGVEGDLIPPIEKIHLEHPQEEAHGDYATNAAMKIAQNSKLKTRAAGIAFGDARQNHISKLKAEKIKSPLDMAKVIVKNLPKADYLEKVEVAPPGFINFWLSKEYLTASMLQAVEEKGEFGKVTVLKGKKIMVEFAHPNTLKPFHIGHLRNITLGESIVRILEANGFAVIRANYQGDVGLHIAKCLYGIKSQNSNLDFRPRDLRGRKLATQSRQTQNYNSKLKTLKTLDQKIEFLGKAYVEGNKAYEEDERAKKEIIKINEQIYNQDPKIMPLWKKTRQWSLDYFDRIYKRVYSRFDRLYFESEVVGGKEIAKEAAKKGILKKSKGAIVFDGEKYGLDTRVFVTTLGFPTYEGKELKLSQLEFSEFGRLDKCIHVVGPEQTSFFKVTFKVEELLDPKKFKNKQYHLVYGWVRLKKGKMSSRAGQVILGDWLLDEVKRRLLSEYKMDEGTAETVAVAAVKYSLLKFSPQREIVFDIDESINMEGDSGPYLQYTYARCKSVLRKGRKMGAIPDRKYLTIRYRNRLTPRVNEEELAILRTIYRFLEVVKAAGENYAPNLICNFLFDLAQKYNAFYNKHRILEPTKDTSEVARSVSEGTPRMVEELASEEGHGSSEVERIRTFRLALTAATAQILKNGLYLLGIKTLDRM